MDITAGKELCELALRAAERVLIDYRVQQSLGDTPYHSWHLAIGSQERIVGDIRGVLEGL